MAGRCESCHSGAYPAARGRGASHVPVQAVAQIASAGCDACHRSVASWLPAGVHQNFSLATDCQICHSGAFPPAVGKPNTAIHAGVTACQNCHSASQPWSGGNFAHSAANAVGTGACDTCHNGSTATGKPGSHIPVALGSPACDSCHRSQSSFAASVSMNHAAMASSNCSSCHSGAYASVTGKPVSHMPVQAVAQTASADCKACHATTTNWLPARVHQNFSIATDCQICHNGAYPPAVGKPNNALHAGVTTCQGCHNASQPWTSATFAHSPANAVGTGTCDTCHNGSTATGKPASHIPTPLGAPPCDSCHRSQSSFAVSVTMNHGAVAAMACKTCHSGAYTAQGASTKPGNHIPESQLLNGVSLDCNACHRSTTSWPSITMNHNGSQGSGAGWCKGCHLSGTSYLGGMRKRTLTHERSTGAIDCSTSGCHRPLGNEGQPYREW
ncbi:MAG: cytochrome c3 family protein [Burkholderiaceae bacterium]